MGVLQIQPSCSCSVQGLSPIVATITLVLTLTNGDDGTRLEARLLPRRECGANAEPPPFAFEELVTCVVQGGVVKKKRGVRPGDARLELAPSRINVVPARIA